MKEELKEELILYIKKNSFTDIFQGFCLKFKKQRFPQALSMAVSKIAYLTYQTFFLDLLRLFFVSFCLCTMEATNTRDILLPNIVLSVLQFIRFYLILPSFIPPILFFFSTSIFSEI